MLVYGKCMKFIQNFDQKTARKGPLEGPRRKWIILKSIAKKISQK